MLLRIDGHDLPGRTCGDHRDVEVGIQIRRDVEQVVPATGDQVRFEAAIEVVDRPEGVDFRGPCVQGRPGQRFVYLSWGEGTGGQHAMFRRAKLMLDAVPESVLEELRHGATVLHASLGLTDAHGLPLCAAVRPPAINWTAESS